ncbi:MAG: dihydroorotate dehydrogenase electron transfer subunit, partial [Chloroflexota bacterium]
MRQTRAFIEGNEPLLPGTGILWLRAPDVARAAAPGQFLLARCSDGYDPLLRRPLSVHRIKPGTGAEGS